MPVGDRSAAARPSRQNLFRVWLIRSILLVVLIAILVYLKLTGGIELPWLALSAVLALAVVFNLALVLRLRRDWPVSETEFFGNLLADILFLTALLYLTGGSTNPLVSYYLIPLIISAAVLRPRFTWIIALLTLSAYTFLLFYYVPLALFSMQGHGAMMGAHFLGMWINFAFSAVLIAWFVVRMANTMREQDKAIARSREAGLRDEQIITVAGIAAGTAHELRTPLATMTVLADEMKDDHPELAEDLDLLQEQLDRCDSILRQLVSTTADSGLRSIMSIGDLFHAVMDKWSLTRPEVALHVRLPRLVAELEIESDQSFRHALLNFLNNAADASPDDVRLEAETEDDKVLILVKDRGPGIPAEIVEALGKRYISNKKGGLGLGVLLSSASVERLHGDVTLLDRPGGGTQLEIRLPIEGRH
jgi:two-component system sensor histidine kinase RegB